MTGFELLLLAVSLCFDTFAVSLGGGMSVRNVRFSKKARVMAFFACFQAGLLFLGWAIGASFASFIMDWDHWIAFAILMYIGGKMVVENFKEGFGKNQKETSQEEEQKCCCKEKGINLLRTKTLVTMCIATSIDAIAVGASLAFVDILPLQTVFVTLMTFIFTALACYIGITSGEKIGCRFGAKATFVGGAVLVFIGIKILLEHIIF